MEAASVAWHPLQWTPVGFSEIEPFPCAILKHRFPNVPNYGDITKHAEWPIQPGAVDLLVGGSPCQSFSVAGLRKGMADPRGNLALVFLGLADRIKPKWIIWENVPGVLSSNGGKDFGSFLGALGELGYGFAYRVLDAQNFGVPQRRRRVFVVACLGAGGWESAAKVLFEPESLRGDSSTSRKKGKGVAPDAGGGSKEGCLPRTVGTICADSHPGAYTGQDAYTGRLIPSHWEGSDIHPTLNQCHNIGSPGYSNQELFSQKGAGLVPVPIQDGRDIEKHQNGLGVGKPGDPAYTVDTTGSQAAGVIAIQGTIIGRSKNAGPQGIGATEGGPMFTLTKSDVHGVAMQPMAVRRLTPRECERLQGFPDDWSLMPWKGKPVDQCPDGPRYKACGNSMAVPCMSWIGKRIAKIEYHGKES
jgi:DNA (cytosine-5)-methyltransferase 1